MGLKSGRPGARESSLASAASINSRKQAFGSSGFTLRVAGVETETRS
jgi:hypothetical protein